jgi:hypothetical protein
MAADEEGIGLSFICEHLRNLRLGFAPALGVFRGFNG